MMDSYILYCFGILNLLIMNHNQNQCHSLFFTYVTLRIRFNNLNKSFIVIKINCTVTQSNKKKVQTFFSKKLYVAKL